MVRFLLAALMCLVKRIFVNLIIFFQFVLKVLSEVRYYNLWNATRNKQESKCKIK